jgi:acetyltransferase-like isoleucine patch superfamily enzyme
MEGRMILRRIVRTTYFAVMALAALPAALPAAALAIALDRMGRYVDVAVCLAYLPFRWGEVVRNVFYRLTLEGVGQECAFKFGSFCQYREARLGDRVVVGFFTALGKIAIGSDVLIGGYVLFTSGRKQHAFDDPAQLITRQMGGVKEQLRIGDDVWIGSKAIVMADVGTRCVVGAGSVVTRPVTDGTVVAGNPARLLREIPGIVKPREAA